MLVKLLRNLGIGDRGNVPGAPKKGSIHEVKRTQAELLISRNLAVSVEPEVPVAVVEPEPEPAPVALVDDDEPRYKEPAVRRTRKKKTKTGDYKDG